MMTPGELATVVLVEVVIALLAIAFLVNAALATTNAIERWRTKRRER